MPQARALRVLAGAIIGDRFGPPDRDLVVDFDGRLGLHHGSGRKKRSKLEQKRRAFRQRVDQHVLVVGMGAAAACAQAVERRNAQGRGEVAVAAAAG